MQEIACIEAGVRIELERPAPGEFCQNGKFEVVENCFVIKIRIQIGAGRDRLLVLCREVGDRLQAVALTALTGKVQFHLKGEPVVNVPFALDAKIRGKTGGIVAAQLVAAAAAEVGDAETTMDAYPGRLGEGICCQEEGQDG